MSNQLTKPIKEGHLMRYIMRGVLTVRLLSVIAIFSIISGYWLSIDSPPNSEEVEGEAFSQEIMTDSPESQDGDSEGGQGSDSGHDDPEREAGYSTSESDLPNNLIIGGGQYPGVSIDGLSFVGICQSNCSHGTIFSITCEDKIDERRFTDQRSYTRISRGECGNSFLSPEGCFRTG